MVKTFSFNAELLLSNLIVIAFRHLQVIVIQYLSYSKNIAIF